MWLFTSTGFLSIVQDGDDPDRLIVRSRFPGHIRNLFPKAAVKRTPGRDYRYRASVPRSEVAAMAARQVEAIGYGNFKDSIGESGYHRACTDVWNTLYKHQR